MQNSRDEMFLVEQSLKNINFLIQLQLNRISTAPNDGAEVVRRAAELRRMMELEEELRTRQLTAGHASQARVAA